MLVSYTTLADLERRVPFARAQARFALIWTLRGHFRT